MRRYRHKDIRTTIDVYVSHNPLLDEAQHRAVVANGNGNAVDSDPNPQAMATDISVPEMEAVAKVRSLGISWRSLREHAIREKAAVERKKRLFYSASFLDALCEGWMTKAEAMRLLGLASSSGFFNRAKAEGFRTLVIGRASLVSMTDVMGSLRNGQPKDE
ncbi:MAG: hypothetical protein ACI9X0_001302 [Kiritimatiellia bacterium]|jgi:hypothetical protein